MKVCALVFRLSYWPPDCEGGLGEDIWELVWRTELDKDKSNMQIKKHTFREFTHLIGDNEAYTANFHLQPEVIRNFVDFSLYAFSRSCLHIDLPY